VVCFSGDGDFMMTGQELATAVQYRVPVLFVVVTTECTERYECIRNATFLLASMATALQNPDFSLLAQAYGAFGEVVERTDDFASSVRTRDREW
jgi:acetolactate synthase-1/2/3 large subunit